MEHSGEWLHKEALDKEQQTMKKKPDLVVLIVVIFGLGVAVNAVAQAFGF